MDRLWLLILIGCGLVGGGIATEDASVVAPGPTLAALPSVSAAPAVARLPEVDPEIVSYGGNTSLEGCRLAALYGDKIAEVETIASMITNIELSTSNMYMDEYVAALFLPHTRMEEFPLRAKKLEQLRKNISGLT